MRMIFTLLALAVFGCSGPQADKQKNIISQKTKDSLIYVQHQRDYDSANTCTPKTTIKIGDKSIRVLSQAVLTPSVEFEYEYATYGTYYRQHLAERSQTILNMRVRVSSGSKYSALENDSFLPDFNVFVLDKKTKELHFLGHMDFNLYQKSDLPGRTIEGMFDYTETLDLVYWKALTTPINGQIIVSVEKGHKGNFRKSSVIAIKNPSL